MAKDHDSDDNRVIQYQMGPKTTHVRHDAAHCLAPGLFRSLKRGERKKQNLHVIYQFGTKELIEFIGPWALGAEDLVVLQGLVAMSAPQKLLLNHKHTGKAVATLREGLELKWDAMYDVSAVISSSLRKLAREIGYDPDSGGDLKTIVKCIERLWAVSIIVQTGNIRKGYRLLSSYTSQSKTGKLLVALNPRVTEAIFGERPYTRINMEEVRQIKSDPARILHQRLSAIIAPGQSKKIFPETLIPYIWPDSVTGSTLRTRRQVLKKALVEIAATGAWDIKDGYHITRKAAPKILEQKAQSKKKPKVSPKP